MRQSNLDSSCPSGNRVGVDAGLLLHIHGRDAAIPDSEGVELPDLWAAYDYAVEDARFLVEKRMLGLGYKQWQRWRVEVTDDAGRQVLAVPFAQAID